MLVLNNKEILDIVSYEEIMYSIEKAYEIYENDNYFMPDRFHLDYKNKTLLYMPCFADGTFGTKILTVFPENIEKRLPSLDGLMLLNDYETGAPSCLMDGKTLTALRTGAVGGVGIKHTTPETVKTIGLIGAGAQGFYQMIYACKVRNFEKIFIFDSIKSDKTEYIANLKKAIDRDVEIILCEDSKTLLENSEVIVTATTATSPTLPDSPELLKNKHFIGIGSYKPNMREYPDSLFPLLDSVYIDADIALEESGDLIQPIDKGILDPKKIKRFSKYLLEEKNKEQIVQRTTFFKSVGIALFDILAANIIYKNALKKGIGYKL